MADSPHTPPYRLLGKSESIRCLTSKGATGFALGFTLASTMFLLFIHLNPSMNQFSFRSSRRHHFSKVFGHLFPHSTPTLESSAEEVSPMKPRDSYNENYAKDPTLESGNSHYLISRKEGYRLAPTGSHHNEGLTIDGSQNGVHPPTAMNNRMQPQHEETSSPSPAATDNRMQPQQEEISSPSPAATDNRIQPQQEESSSPSPAATDNRIQPQQEEISSPSPAATDNRIQPQREEPSSPSPAATDNRMQPQQEEPSSSSPTASQNAKQSEEGMEPESQICDIFEGSWVRDDSYPLYKAGSCPYIDEPFDCFRNGKSDNLFEKYRWQPKHCNIPRLKGNDMLEILRGKRLVFVGDSLNRNMWESLVCILRNSVEDKSSIFEASGREEFRTEGSYSFIFREYNCSIEFFRSVFLVQEWEIPDTKGSTKETLRLDLVERSCDKYKDADILVFNTGHWWTHEKRTIGKEYYQEGNYIHGQLDVEEAFHKAMLTWSHWVDNNIDPQKTIVFFRGYSPSHFRDGEWNSGGQCHTEMEPRKNESDLAENPPMMRTIESVIERMKTPVFYLNITRLTDMRHDAHPSMYRNTNMTEETKRYMLTHQDCSHWCLPGVPDLWNELVYAHLLNSVNTKKGNNQ